MYRYTKIFLLTAALAAAGSAAYAAKSDMHNDAASIVHAKLSLTQAIGVAEQHANGKASRAEFEHAKRGWVYDVEVVSGVQVFDVRVDADSGVVIASREDEADHDGGDDSDD